MGKRFAHGGMEYEELGGGKVRVVGPATPVPFTAVPLPQSPQQVHNDQRQADRDRQTGDNERERLRMEKIRLDAELRGKGLTTDASGNIVSAPAVALGDQNKVGPEYLASLPTNIRNRVQQLLDGRSILTAREKGTPLGQQLMDAANQVDPNFDENVSHARYLERQQYTGMGKGSLAVQAAERLAMHANDLYAASNDLAGPDLGWSPLSNAVTSAEQSFQQAKVARYNTILPLIAGELQKLTKNGAATVDESKHIMTSLAPGQPRDVRNAALQEVVRLGEAQMQPLRESWASAWQGRAAPPMPMDFSPTTEKIFDAIANGDPSPKVDRNGHIVAGLHDGSNPGNPGSGGNGGNGSAPIDSGPPPSGAPAGSTDASTQIPKAMQAEYDAYLAKNTHDLDPDDYAHFRADLDRKYNFPANSPDQMAANRAWAASARQRLQQGGRIINTLPAPTRKLSWLSEVRNDAVNNPGGAFLASMGNAGGFGIPSLLAGDQMAALREANPTSSTLGEIAGGITGAMEGGAALSGASRFVTNEGARSLLTNPITADVAYGTLYGATQADDPLYGGVGGAASALVGHGIGRGLGRLGRGFIGTSDPLSRGERAYFNAADRTGVDNVASALRQAGDLGVPATPADVSSDINSLTGAAIRRSPVAAELARNTIGTRSRGQFDRFTGAIERNLGPAENIPQRSEDLITQARSDAGPLYDAAYAAPGAGAVHPQIEPLLNRPSMQSALSRARTIAAEEGRDPASLGFDLDPQGNVVLRQVPSWQTLDYTKRGMDDVLEGYRDGTTGRLNLDEHGRAIDNTRRQFLDLVDAANPDYAAARATYAGPAAERDGLRMGQDAVTMSPDQLTVNYNRASPAQRGQYRLGFQSKLVENASRIRLANNPFESTLGTPAMERRLTTLYPEGSGSDVPRLLLQRNLERDVAASGNRLVGNSMTAERQIADDAFGNGGGLGDAALEIGANVALGQVPIGTAIRGGLSRGLRDQFKLGVGRRGRSLADEIAPIALDPDTQQAIDRLAAMQQQNAARDAIVRSLMQTAGLRAARVGAGTSSAVAASLMRH